MSRLPAATAGGARVPGVGVSRPNNEKYYTDLLSAAALPGHTRPHCTRQPLKTLLIAVNSPYNVRCILEYRFSDSPVSVECRGLREQLVDISEM